MRWLFLFFLSTTLWALPIGNPAQPTFLRTGVFVPTSYDDPSWIDTNLRLGYYGDFVFNRKLDLRNTGEGLGSSKINTNSAYIGLNILERGDFYALIGGTDLRLRHQGIVLQTDTDFSWSVGYLLTLLHLSCLDLAFEGQYFSSKNNIDSVTGSTEDLSDLKLEYQEWQFGGSLGTHYACFFPYVGIKYSSVKINIDAILDRPFPKRLKIHNHIGLAVGASIVGWERVSLTGEGRFSDEIAFHLNALFRF